MFKKKYFFKITLDFYFFLIILRSGCARRGDRGALYPKTSLCGAEFLLEEFCFFSASEITGRRATDNREPRQIWKEAAISENVCVMDRSRLYKDILLSRFQEQVHNLIFLCYLQNE